MSERGNMRRAAWLPVFAFALGIAAAVPARAADPNASDRDALNATLWMQSSPEYRAAAMTAYAAARAALDKALADPAWTAAVEQGPDFRGKPPAVIFDIDETALSNSAYLAWLVTSGAAFNAQTWSDFIEERAADAVPGAVEYAKYAASKGVTLFFVSNRIAKLEDATRDNLKSLGFPLKADEDTVLLKRERREWGVQKGTRRAYIAERYRIVQIVGDDLGDFVDDYGVTMSMRAQEMRNYASYWGGKWIMLPNPVYGAWENSAFEYNIKLDEAGRHAEKLRALAPWK